MYNYIKKYLLVLFILLMPGMNVASKALDTDDYRGASGIHKRQLPPEDQKSILSSKKPAASSRLAQLSDLSTSLVSSVAAPVKRTLQVAKDVVDFSIQHPKTAMIVGTVLTLDYAMAACACFCYNNGPKFYGECAYDLTTCTNLCSKIGFPAAYCMVGQKGCN